MKCGQGFRRKKHFVTKNHQIKEHPQCLWKFHAKRKQTRDRFKEKSAEDSREECKVNWGCDCGSVGSRDDASIFRGVKM